ncbi:hypothetical protein ENUP19_0337G0017 [Entamoeba nuttalli]|uniref:Uncharacterized protein n=1 Tax=Entamoeba nuttalli TaxID=412467 RepID=A0ABQ0DWZ9_9EUKA
MFVYCKTKKEIIRIAEMYGKWLDMNEIILGQLTLPFLNCKSEEKEIESHSEYCLIALDVFYKLIDS